MTADGSLTKAQQIEAAWARHDGKPSTAARKPARPNKQKPKRDSEAEEIELLLKHI